MREREKLFLSFLSTFDNENPKKSNNHFLCFFSAFCCFSVVFQIDLYSEQINKDRYGYIESVAIWLSIMITVFVMATSEYGKEAKFRGLINFLLSLLLLLIIFPS